jgi:CBS domain-containing protein
MKVKDILIAKGTQVVTIPEDETIFQALQIFAKNKVGSLLVLNQSNDIVGIISPRDVLTELLKDCEKIRQIIVKNVMTTNLIIGTPDDELEYVMAIMTENRIRHLPILENKRLAGIISIGDVVKTQIKQIHAENHYLRDFIEGKYPA